MLLTRRTEQNERKKGGRGIERDSQLRKGKTANEHFSLSLAVPFFLFLRTVNSALTRVFRSLGFFFFLPPNENVVSTFADNTRNCNKVTLYYDVGKLGSSPRTCLRTQWCTRQCTVQRSTVSIRKFRTFQWLLIMIIGTAIKIALHSIRMADAAHTLYVTRIYLCSTNVPTHKLHSPRP